MSISANALLHFTDSLANVLGILRDAFYPRYSLEKYRLGEETIEAGFPLISFCDIPLSQLKNHISTYGSYGIGMSMEWAESKGLNPILYMKADSNIGLIISDIITGMKQADGGGQGPDHEYLIRNIRAFMKPYEGEFARRGKKMKVRFYNEREWRYVPPFDSDLPLLDKSFFSKRELKGREDRKLRKYKLDYDPSDIRYIIVKEEKEIPVIVRTLKKIRRYNQRTVEILISRIITSEQILNDF